MGLRLKMMKSGQPSSAKTSLYWVIELLKHSVHWLIDWFKTSKPWFLHWSGRVTHASSNFKRNVWTLVIRRGSVHSKISKTAMFNRRPTGSPFLNIFESNLLQWFYNWIFNIETLLRDHTGANFPLARFQSRPNVKQTTCIQRSALCFFPLKKTSMEEKRLYWWFSILVLDHPECLRIFFFNFLKRIFSKGKVEEFQ